MTSQHWPDHLLSLDEWDALPEDVSRRFELVEGLLQMSPRPAFPHQVAGVLLTAALNATLIPARWIAVPEVDVVLVGNPPIVRAPDISVVSLAVARDRPTRLGPGDVRVAVEIVSPGSARIDRIAKMADYADAGIPDYWIVDVDGPVTLDAFRLIGESYQPVVAGATGTVTLSAPVPVTLDLTTLIL